jgi:hypothetical protein
MLTSGHGATEKEGAREAVRAEKANTTGMSQETYQEPYSIGVLWANWEGGCMVFVRPFLCGPEMGRFFVP